MQSTLLKNVLQRFYGLSNFDIYEYPKQGPAHKVFQVKEGRGFITNRDSRSYILKVYNTTWSNYDFIARGIKSSVLFKKFFTPIAVAPIKNIKGEYLTVFEDCTCALFDFVEHVHISRSKVPSVVHLRVAAFLGQIHNRYIEHKEEIDSIIKKEKFIQPQNALAWMSKNLGEFKEKKEELSVALAAVNKEWSVELERFISFAEDMLREYRDVIMSPVPLYLSHWDITVDNLLFNEKFDPVGLIDFDRVAYISLFREVWHYLFNVLIAPRKVDPTSDLVISFLNTYKKNFKYKINKDEFFRAKLIELIYWSTKYWIFAKLITEPKRGRILVEGQDFLIQHSPKILYELNI